VYNNRPFEPYYRIVIKKIIEKRLDGERITSDECLQLFRSKDVQAMGQLANTLVDRLPSSGKVSYIVDRNINYTNECTAECHFCAFYEEAGSEKTYHLSREQFKQKIQETVDNGGVQILLQGGLSPKMKLSDYEELFSWIKENFPVHLHALSPPEIHYIAKKARLSLRDTILRLKKAGLDSIPGGGAEILVDKIRRKISPKKCNTQEWISVMEAAHCNGLKSSATMMFGHIETIEDRVEHLYRIRSLQEKTGGFTAFIPWSFQDQNTKLEGKYTKTSGLEYLKTLAISRIYLDNIDNVQASWVTQGAKVGEMALFYGANDMGSVMMEENVVKAAGTSFSMTEKDIRRIIQNVRKTPVRRNFFYDFIETVGQ